jgi:rhodanese-related sulfurtransferase
MTEQSKKIIRYIAWGLLAILVLVSILLPIIPGVLPVKSELKKLPLEVSVAEVHEAWQQGATILDVRALSELQEWGAGHIQGAILIPVEQLSSRIEEIPRDKPIYVVCTSGKKSAMGRDTLLAAGFEMVTSMEGGMNQWVDSGYEIVSRP